MDRQIPDVWNIFSIAGPAPDYKTKKATALASTNGTQWSYHHNWNVRSQEMLHKWSDRTSPCDRPRTYDKFYAKLPGNYIDPRNTKSHGSLCSSDAELEDNEEAKKRKKRKRNRKYSRTVTERDVRHLERHLSMKKTIRKKIMRDLQQAFVNDNESPDNLDCNRLNFDPKKRNAAGNDAKLLDLLKQEEDSGLGTDDQGGQAGLSSPNSSEHLRVASLPENRKYHSHLISDSSSCSDQSEKDIILLAAEQIQTLEVIEKTDEESKADKPKKRSFWQKLTGKKS